MNPNQVFHIPGSSPAEGESIDVIKNPGADAPITSIDLARVAVDTILNNHEYAPGPETLHHVHIIDMASRLHDAHRKSIASDVDYPKAA